MAVLDIARVRVEPPATLPIDSLSWSSIRTFMSCPEKWRRRYIDHEPEPPSGKMVLGSSAGHALAQHYGSQIETGEGIGAEELLDEFSTELDGIFEREPVIFGEGETPGGLKDSGACTLAQYHRLIAPEIQPVAVERELRIEFDGVDWFITSFLDLETTNGDVGDYKMTGKKITQAKADGDLQAGIYLLGRWSEGNPALAFAFHAMVRTKIPQTFLVHTTRSEMQLGLVVERIFRVAAEIDWRCQTGNWNGAAPGSFSCSTCRYHDCPWRIS